MSSKKKWSTFPALAAIARNVKTIERAFTARDLSAWATTDAMDFPAGIAAQALDSLRCCAYAAPVRTVNLRLQTCQWRMTATGLQAAQAALLATTDGPDQQALATRVWNLLRIRKHLTAFDAAQTLVDAGDDFDAQVRRIGALLLAWSRHAPATVSVAKKREAGRLRYVMTCDLGRWPPPARAGQMHPNEFANPAAVPERYRKAAPAQEGAAQ